ncbi:hypothetical protein GCM10009575_016990 [Streptomyces rhizosphaericus]|uniref:Uncharacterized protein n=1 Tax=Streptomyces rhizosphaericus TaxID=114699 RepID=A0ABP3ZKS4_9ACTN
MRLRRGVGVGLRPSPGVQGSPARGGAATGPQTPLACCHGRECPGPAPEPRAQRQSPCHAAEPHTDPPACQHTRGNVPGPAPEPPAQKQNPCHAAEPHTDPPACQHTRGNVPGPAPEPPAQKQNPCHAAEPHTDPPTPRRANTPGGVRGPAPKPGSRGRAPCYGKGRVGESPAYPAITASQHATGCPGPAPEPGVQGRSPCHAAEPLPRGGAAERGHRWARERERSQPRRPPRAASSAAGSL